MNSKVGIGFKETNDEIKKPGLTAKLGNENSRPQVKRTQLPCLKFNGSVKMLVFLGFPDYLLFVVLICYLFVQQ